MHAALAQCLPPPISLQCLPVAWLPSGLVELEVTGGLHGGDGSAAVRCSLDAACRTGWATTWVYHPRQVHPHTHRDPLFAAVTRTAEGQASSPARLLVGSLHDDALLLCRALVLEQFPSPLVLRCQTRTPVKGRGKAIEASRAAAGGTGCRPTRINQSGAPATCRAPRLAAFSMPGCLGVTASLFQPKHHSFARPLLPQLVASVVHERLVGVDMAVRTVVPSGVELHGQRFQPPPPRPPVASSPADAANPGVVTPADAGLELSTEEAAGIAALPTVGPAEQGLLLDGTADALRLMQRRQGSTDSAPRAAPVPATAQAPTLQLASQAVANAAADTSAGSKLSATPDAMQRPVQPQLAAAAKGKWGTFVQGSRAACEPQSPAQQLPREQEQQAQQPQQQGDKCKTLGQKGLRSSLSQWQQRQPQRAGMHLPGSIAAAPAAGGSSSLSTMLPSSIVPSPSFQTGGLFARFALGSRSTAGAPVMQTAVQQPPAATALQQGREHQQPQLPPLFGSWCPTKLGASSISAGQENDPVAVATSKRRKLSSLLPPSRQPDLLELPVMSSVEAAPEAALPRRPLLPNLAWLSGRFSSADAAMAPAAPKAPLSAAQPPADVLPPALVSLHSKQTRVVPNGAPAEVPSIGGGLFDFL